MSALVDEHICDCCGVKCLLVQRAVAKGPGDLLGRCEKDGIWRQGWLWKCGFGQCENPQCLAYHFLEQRVVPQSCLISSKEHFLSIASTKPRSAARQFILYFENQEIGTETDKALALCQGCDSASAKLGSELELIFENVTTMLMSYQTVCTVERLLKSSRLALRNRPTAGTLWLQDAALLTVVGDDARECCDLGEVPLCLLESSKKNKYCRYYLQIWKKAETRNKFFFSWSCFHFPTFEAKKPSLKRNPHNLRILRIE